MLGSKSSLALRVGGLVLTTGVLAVVMTPSTALPAGGPSTLAPYKHNTANYTSDGDQSSAYGFERTFPADPPAVPYLGSNRPYEQPTDYIDDQHEFLVSDDADGSLHRPKRRSIAKMDTTDEASEHLAAVDSEVVSRPDQKQYGMSSESETKGAMPSSLETIDPHPLPTAPTPTSVAYSKPPML